jgi:predicted CXXCH cytochrome family protein
MVNRASKLCCIVCVAIFFGGEVQAGLEGSAHDFSASRLSRGTATGRGETCVFCHTPHTSAPQTPNWSRSVGGRVYIPYSSSTMEAVPGQPTGTSKLCLSCHDGTIGLDSVGDRLTPVPIAGLLSRRSNLSTDLSDDHPISFPYDFDLAARRPGIVPPTLLPQEVRLDGEAQVQCTTCHDSHSDEFGDFLVMSNESSALCRSCHEQAGWAGSSHESSGATWNGIGADPWPYTRWNTVASAACENCHTPHGAETPERLLKFAPEEENCLVCHDGSVARTDIESEIQKWSRHPVGAVEGAHDPIESAATMPGHVECEDCHNPHAVTDAPAQPPNVTGPLTFVRGVTSSGAEIESAQYEYEVCFRCHSDNPGAGSSPLIDRQIAQPSLRLKFDTLNPSFHPVEAPGRNPDVPSLLFPLTAGSVIYCGDCHNNESGPGANGSGPNGPHGSIWPSLLEREYRTADNTAESSQVYSLCYKCHDRSSILNDDSFKSHQRHVREESSPCSSCHDPHGISATQGDATNHSHLINFDMSIVSEDPVTGRLEFVDLGSRRGECYLSCHGSAHSPKSY